MTIVAAVKDGKGIYMGADSLGSNGMTGSAYKNKKVIKTNDFLIGMCGSYRLMDLVTYKLVIPKIKVDQDVCDYIHTDFCDAIILLLKNNGCLEDIDKIQQLENANFIFAFKDKLFKFQSDLSILEPKADYVTCGSGEYHAQASLFSTQDIGMDGEERIKRAILCANNFVVSVNDDIEIEFIKGEKNVKANKK